MITEPERLIFLDKIKSNINAWMSSHYPLYDKSQYEKIIEIQNMGNEIKEILKKQNKKIELMESKIENVFTSSSICEDVYKMRDEFKDFKKQFESFNNKLKKVFEK